MRIEMGPSIQLAARDTILAASDGLFDNLTFDDIVDAARRRPLSASVGELAGAAQRRMRTRGLRPSKPDDLTIIAYRPLPRRRPKIQENK
jgi:hypothetical protein